MIFNDCTDYWDGNEVKIITPQMRKKTKAMLAQWNDLYETVGFSYKPVSQEFEQSVLTKILETNNTGRKH